MSHPSEDELALYAFDPDATAERDQIDSHVATCPRCSATLTFIRSVMRDLPIAMPGKSPSGKDHPPALQFSTSPRD